MYVGVSPVWGDDFRINGTFNFLSGSLDPRITFTRASSAWDVTDGTLVSYSNNQPRMTSKGWLCEAARTNVVLWNRDLTNAAWVKTTCTAALNQTGLDGVSNSASSITATAGNATCLQSITLGSSARAQSAFVRRLVGSGVVEMTMDNGTTWTAITVTGSWTRVTIPTQTIANPTVGFRLVTSGDSIAVDLVQNENGTLITSPIVTTSAAVTRLSDSGTSNPASFGFNQDAGTFIYNLEIPFVGVSTSVMTLDGVAFSGSLRHDMSGTGFGQLVVLNNTGATDMNAGGALNGISGGTAFKSGISYADNSCRVCVNGGTPTQDTAIAINKDINLVRWGGLSGRSGFIYYLGVTYTPVNTSQAALPGLTV